MSPNNYFKKYTELGYHPDDSEEEKVNKSTLVVLSLPFAAAGLIWGILYFINGLMIPGYIPFSYGILSILSFVNFSITKKYTFFRNSQLFLILILPFLLQLSLGGFIPSSAVIIWALISPVGALVFFKTNQSLLWFAAYLALVVTAFFINDYVSIFFDWGLSDRFINVVFLLNIIAVSSLIYAIQYYYVGKQTELKEAIEEKNIALEEQTEKLKEMDETKSRFFANISHEFRTPLTLILGLVNKQISNYENAPIRQDSETMKRNANRLLQLINQLLDLSKLESGEISLSVAKDDILEFSRKTIILFESHAESKKINILFNGHDMTKKKSADKIIIYFDHDKMQKVITNLLSNAIKFATAESTIHVNVLKKGDFVSIGVTNIGKGIASEKLSNVFDRFYQVDTASTRAYEGTGIGLALVKELMELHHGKVNVISESKVTTFTLTLPLDENLYTLEEKVLLKDRESESVEDSIEAKSSNNVEQKTIFSENEETEKLTDQLEILIVEDNPDLRDYISDILKKDYKVIKAVDGIDGLRKAEESVPDLIISDVMMPNMDGYELCKRLKTSEKTNHIPVIILTAKASQQNKLEGLETGADDYLIKPFDEVELLIRIKNLITIREKLQKKYRQNAWLKPSKLNITSVQQKFIEDIKEIIEKNLDNSQYSVEDLGEGIGMSRSQVHRKLKALTDQSASKFMRNYRLHRAAELIKIDSGNITEIAYQVGFSSQTYFSSSFQELFECSPSNYRSRFEN